MFFRAGEAATLAFAAGFAASYASVLDDNYNPVVTVTLRPLTDEDRAKRSKLEAALAAKAASETPAPASDAGESETPAAE